MTGFVLLRSRVTSKIHRVGSDNICVPLLKDLIRSRGLLEGAEIKHGS